MIQKQNKNNNQKKKEINFRRLFSFSLSDYYPIPFLHLHLLMFLEIFLGY